MNVVPTDAEGSVGETEENEMVPGASNLSWYRRSWYRDRRYCCSSGRESASLRRLLKQMMTQAILTTCGVISLGSQCNRRCRN